MRARSVRTAVGTRADALAAVMEGVQLARLAVGAFAELVERLDSALGFALGLASLAVDRGGRRWRGDG